MVPRGRSCNMLNVSMLCCGTMEVMGRGMQSCRRRRQVQPYRDGELLRTLQRLTTIFFIQR